MSATGVDSIGGRNTLEMGSKVAYISSSNGVTRSPQDAGSVDDLLRHADRAMYEAQNNGGNRFTYFACSMQDAAPDAHEAEQ